MSKASKKIKTDIPDTEITGTNESTIKKTWKSSINMLQVLKDGSLKSAGTFNNWNDVIDNLKPGEYVQGNHITIIVEEETKEESNE